jgi:regulator of replication initiation timing
MRNVMSKTKILTKQVQAIELNIVDALEENINLQVEAAVAFSAKHRVNAESEFAKHHRKRVAPRRIDDTPENAVHFGLQTFKIIEPAVSLLKPPYESKIKLFPEMCRR